VDAVVPADSQWRPPLETILQQGTLSRRIVKALDGDMELLSAVYRELCECLAEGRMFETSRPAANADAGSS
jgi:hypothetical protein